MSDTVKNENASNKDILGISDNVDSGLSQVIAKLNTEIETIKAAFLQMETLVNDSSSFFIGDAGDAFRDKFNDIYFYYPNIEESLFSYKTDLENFLNSYVNFEATFSIVDDVESVDIATTTGVTGVDSSSAVVK